MLLKKSNRSRLRERGGGGEGEEERFNVAEVTTSITRTQSCRQFVQLFHPFPIH